MRTALLILCASVAWGALGDNAPAIPSTWVTDHPRLPHPTNAWLTSLWNGGSLPTRYQDAYDDFEPTCATYSCTMQNVRYALLAYRASRNAGTPNTTLRDNLIEYLELRRGPGIGETYIQSDIAVGNGTSTLTAADVNFTTGCGGSCADKVLNIDGFRYYIASVTNATTVVLQRYSAQATYPLPNGTGLKIRVGESVSWSLYMYLYAVVFDYMAPDMTSGQKADYANIGANACTVTENDYVNGNYSPMNDLMFEAGSNGWWGIGLFAMAPAIYPDAGTAGALHLNRMTDILVNRILPTWKHMGGAFNEDWNQYINASAISQKAFILGATLPYAYASGRGISFFTSDHPYIQNFAYFMIYATRPDWVYEYGGQLLKYWTQEHDRCGGGAPTSIDFLDGVAEIYNDPYLRKLARTVNTECGGGPADAFYPSAWPYFEPDTSAKTASDLSGLPLCRNFSGIGTLFCRSNWTEDGTWMFFRYGDKFWGHSVNDAGHFSIFNRGNLAIRGGTMWSGADSKQNVFFYAQAIAHNTMLFVDPADYYSNLTFRTYDHTDGSYDDYVAPPNDGGQRRNGSSWQAYKNSGTDQINVWLNSPLHMPQWLRSREYYKYGNLLAYSSTANYTYIAVDLTKAYRKDAGDVDEGVGRIMLPFGANHLDRSNRAQKFVRHLLWIPRGNTAYVVVYDQTVSTDASFTKKWLLHTINDPTISTNTFTVTRTELATPWDVSRAGAWPAGFMAPLMAYDSGNNYQYNGRLRGWTFNANNNGTLAARTPTEVGGTGYEFWIEDPTDPPNGTNWNQGNAFLISVDPAKAPEEPGSHRIEMTPSGAAKADHFLVLMYASSNSDTNSQASVTATTTSTHYGVTWTDNSGGCSYAVTFRRYGIGGTASATGAGCTSAF